MQIVVRVTGQEEHRPPGSPGDDVIAAAQRAGATLVPQHPGTDDPELARWYVAEVEDPAAAQRLADELLGTPGVDAAYVKPGDEPAGLR
jgi:hypothetical protein